MNLTTRIVLGAALGAILALILHPVSRPYFAAAWHFGDSRVLRTTTLLPENVKELPLPTTAVEAAYWISVSADYDRIHRVLKKIELTQLLRIAQENGKQDSQNGFWGQIESVYLFRLGRLQESRRAWIKASNCLKWNDLQWDRLSTIQKRLAIETGGTAGWQWGYLYERRSPAVAQMISRHAAMLREKTPVQLDNLEIRVASIRNGAMIRDGGRESRIGMIGASMVEEATHPPELRETPSQRMLLVARLGFLNELRESELSEHADRVQRIFRSNESWIALASSDANRDETRWLQLISLLCSVIPGVALIVSAIGVLLACAGRFLELSTKFQAIFSPKFAPFFGAGLAAATYLATRMWIASLLVVLCLGFYTFAPQKPINDLPKDLGPMFRFTLVVLGLAFASVLTLFFGGLSAPGIRLGPHVGFQADYGAGSPEMLGIGAVILGLVLMTAPTWALARRMSAPKIAGLAVREFGLGVFSFFLLIAIVGGPIAVFVDLKVQGSLANIAENEPTYYLIQ